MRHFLLTILFLAILVPASSQNMTISGAASKTNVVPEQKTNAVLQNNFSDGVMFEKEGISVSDAYPNPTTSLATIDYSILDADIRASIVIHNLLGNKMLEMPLDSSQSSVKIPTDEFNSGIYFYSLYVNEKRTMTKKIVVKK